MVRWELHVEWERSVTLWATQEDVLYGDRVSLAWRGRDGDRLLELVGEVIPEVILECLRGVMSTLKAVGNRDEWSLGRVTTVILGTTNEFKQQ